MWKIDWDYKLIRRLMLILWFINVNPFIIYYNLIPVGQDWERGWLAWIQL